MPRCLAVWLFFAGGSYGKNFPHRKKTKEFVYNCVRIRSLRAILPTCHWKLCPTSPSFQIKRCDCVILVYGHMTMPHRGGCPKYTFFGWTSPFEIHNRTVINQSFDTRLISLLAVGGPLPGAPRFKNVHIYTYIHILYNYCFYFYYYYYYYYC